MDGEDPFAAESKYSVLTELASWLRDDVDWVRSVEEHLTIAVDALSDDSDGSSQMSTSLTSTVEDGEGEYSHCLYNSYLAYQDLLERRIEAFLQHYSDKGLNKETLLNQLSHVSNSDDRYSASELQALICRCTSFHEYLNITKVHRQKLNVAREAATDMGF